MAADSIKAIYLCDWLPPEFGAVGQYTLQFARERAATGVDVVLIGLSSTGTSVATEIHGNGTLTIHRLLARHYEKTSVRARLAWTLRTNIRLVAHALRTAGNASEIRFTGSPPFLLHLLVPLNLFWRRRLTYRITDFWPECLMAEHATVPRWLHLFWRLTCLLRRRVDRFEVLGHDQRRRLDAAGIPADRIVMVRDPSPVAVTGSELPLPIPAEIAGYAVLLYSGNWGVAHDVDTFVEGYRLHHREGSGRCALWLNAIGSAADVVERRLRAHGLPIVRTAPVPLADLPRLLVTPAAHLITLKDAFVGYVLPSKVYGCIASGRPVLFVGSAESDVHVLCESAVAVTYRRTDVGNPIGFCTALNALADCRGARSVAAE